MGIGTFGSFTQARLAIYAAQTGLTVTGNNISNINTPGYTRQRLDQKSLYNAGADRYYSTTGVKVGQGVLCYGLSQLRSPYLDIQYRSTSAEVGAMDGMLEGLEGIKQILDEVGKGGEIPEGKEFGLIAAEFRNIYKALENLTAQTGHAAYDVQVRSACKNLADMLRSYAADLEEHYNNTVQKFEGSVSEVNTILTNIRNLNEKIRQADIYGDDALEMRDERNLQIDKLSELIKIDVEYSMESIGPGTEVEKLTIRLGNANPDSSVHTDSSVLIDGIYGAQLSIDPVLNEGAYKYLDANGKLTNDPDLVPAGQKQPWVNPNFGKNPPADTLVAGYPDETVQFLKMDNGKIVEAADAAGADPAPTNTKYDPTQEGLLYMKADGKTPTATYQEAAHDPNFNITVSELRDRLNRILYTYKNYEEEPSSKAEYDAANGQSTSVTDPVTGIITITTYRKQLSSDVLRNTGWIRNSNTAYKYLTPAGQGTNLEDYAATTLSVNDAYDPTKPHDDTNPRYKDENGALTDDPAKAALIPKENPDYKPGYVSGYRYIKYAMKGQPAPTVADPEKPTPAELKAIEDYYTNNIDEARGEPSYYKQKYEKIPSTAVSLDDNDLYGKLQAQRELLTESGEFSSQDTVANIDEKAVTKRGIPYYQKSLDLLAHMFATEMNKANQGYLTNANGDLVVKVWDPKGGVEKTGGFATEAITLDDGAGHTYTLNKADMLGPDQWDMDKVPKEIKDWLEAKGYVGKDGKADVIAYLKDAEQTVKIKGTDTDYIDPATKAPVKAAPGMFVGGNLFSNNGNSNSDDPPITASNISISLKWSSGALIVNSFICPEGSTEPASSDSDNITQNITSLFYKSFDFRPDTISYDGVNNVRHDAMFTGKFEDMWLNMGTVLGNDMMVTSTLLDNNYAAQVSLDTSRDSVSSVDFNDEAMNLMMYAKAYNAACRMMTTIDSVLDKLINNTGLTT